MSIIALTGGIGSGKSEATRHFSALGVPIVDTDVIAHALTAPNGAAIPAIIDTFGHTYVDENGALDRKKIRTLIFNDAAAKQLLEAIMHPRIYQAAANAVQKNAALLVDRHAKARYQVIAVPLLFEGYKNDKPSQYGAIADITLAIDCATKMQIKRTMARSNIDEATVSAIMAAQVSRERRIALADIVIENNGSLTALTDKINKLHHQLNEKCDKLARESK